MISRHTVKRSHISLLIYKQIPCHTLSTRKKNAPKDAFLCTVYVPFGYLTVCPIMV